MTVGQIRAAINGLPDRAPLYIKYGDVENRQTFVRLDHIEQTHSPRKAGAIANFRDPPGIMLTLSLVCPDEHE